MKKLLHRIEEGMDNLKIKKKLYMLYLICVLIPIIITDSVIFFIVRSSEQEKQQHEMANIANAVNYNISNTINSIGETAICRIRKIPDAVFRYDIYSRNSKYAGHGCN